MNEILDLKKRYSDWILENMNYSKIDSSTIRIETPFLDNDLDDVILYVDLLPNKRIIISDDGYTLANLESIGYSINNRTWKRKNILAEITNEYGIDFDSKSRELYIKTDFDKFAVSKHRLLQAVLKINDMFLLRPNFEPNVTFESVSKKLEQNDILFSTNYPAIGKGGITFIFDFSIPTRQKKDKLVRIINTPNDLNYSKVLGMDASMLKGSKEADYFAILDDVNHDLKKFSEIESIYHEIKDQYDVNISPIMVSELDNKIELLSN
ncbi:DUF1828 domain-containing protein [Enterococcus avium]|uniref:DUF1828 domain-containing protein n=1 Tax=Enterococcus avium TaxID=33945 RepID=UPI003D6BB7CD